MADLAGSPIAAFRQQAHYDSNGSQGPPRRHVTMRRRRLYLFIFFCQALEKALLKYNKILTERADKIGVTGRRKQPNTFFVCRRKQPTLFLCAVENSQTLFLCAVENCQTLFCVPHIPRPSSIARPSSIQASLCTTMGTGLRKPVRPEQQARY